MSAGRFRPPTTVRERVGAGVVTKQERQAAAGRGIRVSGLPHAAEPLRPPVLRRSRKGLVNVPRKRQAAIRREFKRKAKAEGAR